jgi:hypothetical protein
MALVRFRIDLVERTHVKLEHEFEELYALTGDSVFKRAYETIHSVQHPVINQEILQ